MPGESFDRVYKTYFDPVYRYALTLTGDSHAAEEITQETFFKAMRSLKQFRGECSLKSWLYRIAAVVICVSIIVLLISTAGLPVAMSRMISQASSLNDPVRIKRVYNTSRAIFLIIGAVSTALMMFFCKALANSQEQPDAALAIFCLAPSAFLISTP